MNSNRKLLIQALAFVIFSILLYREWNNIEAKRFYVQLLIIVEVAINLIYLFINKDKLKADERDREVIATIIMLIVLVGLRLFNLIVV